MTDYFALLGQPKRPWLDLEQLEKKYHELARTTHPDQSARSADEFAELNKAYRTLCDPKSRMEHLLVLAGKPPLAAMTDVPADLVELFMKIAPGMRGSETESVRESLMQVSQSFDAALHDLQHLDAAWAVDEGCLSAAEKLYCRLSFLGRWKDLLTERGMFI